MIKIMSNDHKLDFKRDFYRRAQDNVINFANKMDSTVNWAITVTGLLIGIGWTIQNYMGFLLLTQILLIGVFIRIDVFRYKNLFEWRYKLYSIQDQISKDTEFDISELDNNTYTKSKIDDCDALFRRLYRVYSWLLVAVCLNTLICIIALEKCISIDSNILIAVSIFIGGLVILSIFYGDIKFTR